MTLVKQILLVICVLVIANWSIEVRAMSDETNTELMLVDFSQALDGCERLSVFDPDASELYGGLDPRELLVEKLTESEERLLSVYRKENGGSLSVLRIAFAAISYTSLHTSRLPVSGVELVLGDLDEVEFNEIDLQNVVDMNADELFRIAFYGINPGTGTFIESFSDPNWHRLGIYIEPVDGDDAIQYLPIPLSSSNTVPETNYGICPFQTWRIVIFGETPDSVLVDKHIWRKIGSASEENAKPCGGCGKKKH